MTKENLERANVLNEQIKVLTKFLDTNYNCWGKLNFFATPKQHDIRISCRTTYGIYDAEISASERLSKSIVETIQKEIDLLQEELDAL